MNIWIVGAGSIGMLYAARTAEIPGTDVRLVARSVEQANRIAAEGLRYRRLGETRRVRAAGAAFDDIFPADGSPGLWSADGCDWIWLAVKQRQLADEVIRRIALQAGERTKLLCFQNGIGHIEKLERHLPRRRLFLAITTEGARREDGNAVEHTGTGITRIGSSEESGEGPSFDGETAPVVSLLKKAGFHAETSNQMNELVWNKLLINAAVNPLTAILRVRNGELLDDPYLLGLMESVLKEGRAVSQAWGIRPADDLMEQLLTVCRSTARNHSSMLQDVMSGRPTEIDAVNGAIVEYGRRRMLETPVNRVLYGLVKALEGDRER